MTNGQPNGLLARVLNLESWRVRMDERWDKRKCQRHETLIGENEKRSEGAVKMAENAEKSTKKMLYTMLGCTFALLGGMAMLYIQIIANRGGP